MNKALELAKKNTARASQKGAEVIERHPWIKEKADELRQIFGPLGAVRVWEDGKQTFDWKSQARLAAEEKERRTGKKDGLKLRGDRKPHKWTDRREK